MKTTKQATIRKTEAFGWIVRVEGEDVFQGFDRDQCVRYCKNCGLRIVRA